MVSHATDGRTGSTLLFPHIMAAVTQMTPVKSAQLCVALPPTGIRVAQRLDKGRAAVHGELRSPYSELMMLLRYFKHRHKLEVSC